MQCYILPAFSKPKVYRGTLYAVDVMIRRYCTLYPDSCVSFDGKMLVHHAGTDTGFKNRAASWLVKADIYGDVVVTGLMVDDGDEEHVSGLTPLMLTVCERSLGM